MRSKGIELPQFASRVNQLKIKTIQALDHKKIIYTASVALLSFIILYLPDALWDFSRGRFEGLLGVGYYPLGIAFGLGLTLTPRRIIRFIAIVFMVLLQGIWIGSLAYFGDVLRPEQVMLSFAQTFEVTGSLVGETEIFVPVLVIVAIAAGSHIGLQERFAENRVYRGIIGYVLLAACVAVMVIRPAVFSNIFYIYPTAVQPSLYGTINTAVLAARMEWEAEPSEMLRSAAAFQIADAPMEAGRTTVVVVMGESISPLRMSYFGGEHNTTPRLLARAKNPDDEFRLFGKVGFSAGVSTISSVPMFLKFPYLPVKNDINLLDLAHDSGFKTWYFSAQTMKPLEIAGGAQNLERYETVDLWEKRVNEIHDDILLEFLQTVPREPEKRFVFLHQRVNHSPYLPNCPGYADDKKPFWAAGSIRSLDRVKRYDTGLGCYDRNLDDILAHFAGQSGAVYVWVTADHNEQMGEYGRYGHSISHLYSALVPMMLYTNRPDSPVARAFADLRFPTAYEFTRLIAMTLGKNVSTPDYRDDVFYINNTMPYGSAGYLEVERKPADAFMVRHFTRDGRQIRTEETTLPVQAYTYAK